MKTLCCMNLKGGVGKTVTADNMAAILAADHRKRVLLIDADHQGNTSRFFLREEEIASTVRDILTGESEPYWPENVYHTGYEGLIIDMPPAFSLAARAALAAADEVIVPIKLDAFSVAGMAELLRQIQSMRKVNDRLTLAGVLITMWRNVDVVNQAEQVLRGSGIPVFRTTIRRTDIVDESTFQRQPLIVYSPRSAACVDYRRLVAEYIGSRETARAVVRSEAENDVSQKGRGNRGKAEV